MKRLLILGLFAFGSGAAFAQVAPPVRDTGLAGTPVVPHHPVVANGAHCDSVSQPLPAVVAATLPTVPTIPPPGSYQLDSCASGTCRTPRLAARDGSCLKKIGAWLSYRPCPGESLCGFQPYHAPLRAYFPCKPGCDTGAAGCGASACATPNCRTGVGPVQRTRDLRGGLHAKAAAPCEAPAPTCSTATCAPTYLRGACPPTRLGLIDRIRSWFCPCEMPCSTGCAPGGCGTIAPVATELPGTLPLRYTTPVAAVGQP